MKIFISISNNIDFNLALENWLFLHELKDEKIVFLWQNSPCVVIGRAQNPWLECNFKSMDEDRIHVARRQSGGGTVYHDYGNLNYTILSPKSKHNAKDNLDLICSIVKNIGIDIYPNERNDIVTDYEGETYKVSGSAFREKRDRAFHHGTLLIHADTNKLYDYLHQPIDPSLDTKGVKSHRSKVLNLSSIQPDIQTQDITRSFFTSLRSIELSIIDENTPLENKELIDSEIEKLKSWDWIFGKTLPFTKEYTNNSNKLIVKVNSGLVSEIDYNGKIIDTSDKYIRFKQYYEFDDFTQYL